MPKVIAGLPEKILSAAKDLFEPLGYDQVEMNMIAERAGIAVGTIYNYYPTKPQLFLATVDLSWSEAEQEMDAIVGGAGGPVEKLQLLMEANYRFIQKKHGMWQTFVRGRSHDSIEMKTLNRQGPRFQSAFVSRVGPVIEEALKRSTRAEALAGESTRLAMVMAMTAFALIHNFPEDSEGNHRFIERYIRHLFI